MRFEGAILVVTYPQFQLSSIRADWDANGDLLYAQAGCIFRVHSDKLDSKEPNKLIDLTDAEFEPIEAPSEFQRW